MHRQVQNRSRGESLCGGPRPELFFSMCICVVIFFLSQDAAGSTLLDASPTTLSFGSVVVGSKSTKAVTLTNPGTGSVKVTQVEVTGGSFSASGLSLPLALAPGESAALSATFAPTTTGSFTGSLSIVSNATDSPTKVSLSGTGSNPLPTLTSLSPSSASAGAAAQTLTLMGTNFLSTSTVTYNGVAHAATFVSSTHLTITLSKGDQATAGKYAVVVTNPAPGGGASNILDFTVTGPTAPIAGLSPASFTFASQPAMTSSSAESFTLSNTGNAALTIASIGFTGTNPGDFSQITTCGSTLALSTTCTIAVTFTPAASGSRSATLVVTDNSNNVAGSTQSSTLTGTGAHDVVLTWTPSPTSGITGYYVYRGTASGAESKTPLNSTPVDATTYVDTNVTAGTTYYYVVTAVIGATQSPDSGETSATVPTS